MYSFLQVTSRSSPDILAALLVWCRTSIYVFLSLEMIPPRYLKVVTCSTSVSSLPQRIKQFIPLMINPSALFKCKTSYKACAEGNTSDKFALLLSLNTKFVNTFHKNNQCFDTPYNIDSYRSNTIYLQPIIFRDTVSWGTYNRCILKGENRLLKSTMLDVRSSTCSSALGCTSYRTVCLSFQDWLQRESINLRRCVRACVFT